MKTKGALLRSDAAETVAAFAQRVSRRAGNFGDRHRRRQHLHPRKPADVVLRVATFTKTGAKVLAYREEYAAGTGAEADQNQLWAVSVLGCPLVPGRYVGRVQGQDDEGRLICVVG